MPNEPIQGGPYPLQSSPANVPSDIKAVVDWTAKKLNMTFATTGERDAKVLSPEDGMVCTVGSGSAAEMQAYMDGAWRPLMTKAVAGRRQGGSGQDLPVGEMTEVEVGPVAWTLGGVVASGNGLQVPTSGLYALDGTVRVLMGPGNVLQGRLMVNGNTVAIAQNSDDLRYVAMATTYPLSAGDVVTLHAYQYTAAGTTSTSSGDPHLTVALIART